MGVGRKDKRPSARHEPPTVRKLPATETAVPWEKMRPSWRVGSVDLAGPFGWHPTTEDCLRKVHQRLKGLESMTWQELLTQRRGKFCHSIPVSELDRRATSRLEELNLDDQAELTTLRVEASARVWGYRDGSVFNLLWWDPDHQVYPMNLCDN